MLCATDVTLAKTSVVASTHGTRTKSAVRTAIAVSTNSYQSSKKGAATEHIDPNHFNIDLDCSLMNVRLCCAWVNVRLCCTRLNMRLESAFWNVFMDLNSAMFYMSVSVP